MIADYHIHTHLCGHAEGEPQEYVDKARERGLKELCFTDHAPAPDGYDPGNRMPIDKYPIYREIVSAMQKQNPDMDILYGIEADYYHNSKDFLKSWLKDNDFDLVIGSVHYLEEWGFDNPAEIKTWNCVNVANTWSEYFEMLAKMANSGLYDIVGHLDLPKKFRYYPPEDKLKEIAAPALDAIASSGMTIELNTSGLRKPIKEIYPSELLLNMAHDRAIPICFGSDSHHPSQIASSFYEAVQLAKNAGYTEWARFRKRTKEFIPLP